MRISEQIANLLAVSKINPNSFEAELGMLIHKWSMLDGIDNVIDGLDIATVAAEYRRDVELAEQPKGRPRPRR